MPSNYTTFTLPYNIEVEIDRERSTAAKRCTMDFCSYRLFVMGAGNERRGDEGNDHDEVSPMRVNFIYLYLLVVIIQFAHTTVKCTKSM